MRIHFVLSIALLGAASACKTTSLEAPKLETPSAASLLDKNAEPEPGPTLEKGRELTRLFYAGETGPLWARMDARMRETLGSEENLAAFRKQVEEQLGTETEVIREQVAGTRANPVYLRAASFSKIDRPVFVQWALDESDAIVGFFVQAP